MANGPGIQITIGANVSQGLAGINQVNAALQNTGKSSAVAATSITKVAAATKAIAPGSNQAANALQNLGRVAQDAPFGFVGIQNNINPLLESFQRLSKEAGGPIGAIKSLGQNLNSAAGLGLAVSVASGLILAFGDEIAAYIGKVTFAESAQLALNKAISDAAASVEGELAQLRSLSAIAADETKSKQARTQALKELQSEYPGYFDNLKVDGTLTEKLATVTNTLTNAILLNAKAKAFQKQIEDSALRVSEAQNKSLLGNLTLLDKSKLLLKSLVSPSSSVIAEAFGKGADRLTQTVKNETKLQVDLAKQLQLTNEALAAQGSLFTDKTKAKKEKESDPLADRIKQLEQLKAATGLLKVEEQQLFDLRISMAQRDASKNGLSTGQLQRVIGDLQQQADNAKFELGIKASIIPPPVAKINTDLAVTGRSLQPLNIPIKINTDEAAAKLKTFQDTMQSAVQSAASSLAQGLGDVLGEALSGGNPLAAGLTLIADTLVQLGKAAVGAGIAMLSLKTLFKNPATAIGAGIAAIALGTAIKASIPKFAEGGVVTGPTMGLIGEAGPEVIFPLSKLNQFINGRSAGASDVMTVEHKVQGQDLLLVINRAQNRWGGSNRF